jgi:hypothetical protein
MIHGATGSALLLLLAGIFLELADSFVVRGSRSTALTTGFRLQASSGTSSSTKSLLIWDCDGVLVDSEALLKQGEVEALEAAGITLSIGTLCFTMPWNAAVFVA